MGAESGSSATTPRGPIVVGIGASAGGIEALKDFFARMPPDSGMAFVVIQHLDPVRSRHMRDVLSSLTPMRVVEPRNYTSVEPNVVYAIPPNTYMALQENALVLTEPIKRSGLRVPIDFFFHSLAQHRLDKAIAVILSGSGADGSRGLRKVRAAGGTVMVQHPANAINDAMPQHAIRTGLVDTILPADELPAAVLSYARRPYVNGGGTETGPQQQNADVRGIVALVARRTQHDFHRHEDQTIRRRIQRQMDVQQIDTASEYLRVLRADANKVTQLAKDLLLGAGGFFRDLDSFEAMRKRVIAALIRKSQDGTPIRVWVPGCGTGEEGYSIAMLLFEEMAAAQVRCPLQIFASDVDEDALTIARRGIYPESIAANVSEERLSRFFTRVNQAYRIDQRVRDVVTFAVHDLISDPPFSKLDAISCRDVLLFFDRELQRRVLSVFAYALAPGGYLFLGSDGVIGQNEFFELLVAKACIYRRTRVDPPTVTQLSAPAEWRAQYAPRLAAHPETSWSDLNQRVLAEHFNAGVVLTDASGTILQLFGNTRKYLNHPTANAKSNLIEMTRDMLRIKLAAALRHAAAGKVEELRGVRLKRAEDTFFVNVTVRPAGHDQDGHALVAVIFEESRVRESAAVGIGGHLDTADANAINENLQILNEQLETSHEELQSLNEELSTVNYELQEKVDELSHANTALASLFSATDVAAVFLDANMNLRRFTSAATELIRLLPTDIGRPIVHLQHDLLGVDIGATGREVLRGVDSIDKDIRTKDGRWYAMRVRPYRALDHRIDGVVVTFHDVTRHKEEEDAIRRSKDKLQRRVGRTGTKLMQIQRALQAESDRRADLAKRLLRLQDEERQRIARELHDTTAQNLAGLGMNVALLEKASAHWAPPLRKAITESTELIYAVMREVRTVSYLLHPPLLEEAGLASALRGFVDGFAKRSGIGVRLHVGRDLGRLPLQLKSVAFRVIQECLRNIHVHSGSDRAVIRVCREGRSITIHVEDCGQGFPRDALNGSGSITARVGTGIAVMHERLREVGGTLRIESKPGRSVVTATIPLPST